MRVLVVSCQRRSTHLAHELALSFADHPHMTRCLQRDKAVYLLTEAREYLVQSLVDLDANEGNRTDRVSAVELERTKAAIRKRLPLLESEIASLTTVGSVSRGPSPLDPGACDPVTGRRGGL